MHSARRVGRTVGLLSIARGLAAPVMNFVLLRYATGTGWLAEAAANGTRVRAGLLLAFAFAGLGLAVAIVARPILRRHSEAMALWVVVLSVLACVTTAIESVTIAGLLSISEEHARAGAAAGPLVAMGLVARATWRWTHYANMLVGHIGSLVFVAALFRFALVPRALAGIVLAATAVSLGGLLMPLLGQPFSFLTMAPMVLQFALLAWLLARGFEEREPSRGMVTGRDSSGGLHPSSA